MPNVTIDFITQVRRNKEGELDPMYLPTRVCMLSKTGENLPIPRQGDTITYEEETFKVMSVDFEYTMDDDDVHVRLYLNS